MTCHPSGLYLLVSFNDKIRHMSVMPGKIEPFHDLSIKGCKEIKFSNGGHLYACHDTSDVHVYRFFTG
jgi:cilia- and flagella-associated protein 57